MKKLIALLIPFAILVMAGIMTYKLFKEMGELGDFWDGLDD